MEVKYVDIPAQFAGNNEVKKVIDEILTSGQFILGPAVEEFEKNFARLCGVKYAASLCSGTDALYLALKILGIGRGDEVITACNSFLATAGAIAEADAFPRLVDVDDDYNISVSAIEKAINKNTKAIIPVHLTGNPAKMDQIRDLAKKHGLFVIEDACQAVDAEWKGKKTGGLGDMGAFSLHPLKNLNTCGDGGVLTTDNEEYYKLALLYRNHGLKDRNESKFFAYNCRLDSIKAAVANLQVKTIRSVSEKRRKNAAIYDQRLSKLKEFITIPERSGNAYQVFHTYVIRVKSREKLIDHLKGKGIETKIHYPIPIHLMEAAKVYGYKKGDFPNAEKQSEEILSLPIHQFLSEEQVNYMADSVIGFFK